MFSTAEGLVFGPVYSRRLGVSLGVNNIPYKVCSYSCVYCQVGRTLRLSVERRRYSDPGAVVDAVLGALGRVTERVDYVTFVPDGEPTLDSALGEDIEALGAELGVRVAVLTNASLLWRPDVRAELGRADLVSVKVDAGREETWRRINRPHPSLSFGLVREGLRRFASEYGGVVIAETMLVAGVNDSASEAAAAGRLAAEAGAVRAYLAVPVRPPAEGWVKPPSEERITEAYIAYREAFGGEVELLLSPEPPPPEPGGDVVAFIAATAAVHPLRLSYVERLLGERGLRLGEVWGRLERLGVSRVVYGGEVFLVKRPRVRFL